jgi:hypothetical protein
MYDCWFADHLINGIDHQLGVFHHKQVYLLLPYWDAIHYSNTYKINLVSK